MESDPDPSSAPARGAVLAGLSLSGVVIGTLLDIVFGWTPAALAGLALLLVYLVVEWRRLLLNARVLLLACLALAIVVALRFDAAILLAAARRMIFLPAFFGLLSLLRAAASVSPTVERAGRHLVNQPPPRRYIALTLGGNLFGILLNIGGLALLLDMTKRANTLAAAGGDPSVVDWRERRMTLAVLRGFAAIPLWSPLGIALNLLLAVIPGVAWIDVAPVGIAATAGFMGLGWVFDRLSAPRGRRVVARTPEPRGAFAVAQVVGHILALSLITLAGEVALALPFQTVLMFAVPGYAFGWLLVHNAATKAPSPLRLSLAQLYERGVLRFAFYANEVAVFAASSFLGIVLSVIVPREPVQALLATVAAPPGVVAAGLSLSVFGLALVGVGPIVSVSIIAGTISGVGVPGLSPQLLVFALAGAWACCVGFGPLTSSLVMSSNLIGRNPRLVGFVWNGPYSLTAMALWLVFLVIVPL